MVMKLTIFYSSSYYCYLNYIRNRCHVYCQPYGNNCCAGVLGWCWLIDGSGGCVCRGVPFDGSVLLGGVNWQVWFGGSFCVKADKFNCKGVLYWVYFGSLLYVL